MASSLLSRRLYMIIILATALLWLPLASNTTNNSNNALVQAAAQLNNINATTQQTDSTTTITTPQLTTIYQSTVDGFRIGVPEGWVVEDTDNTSPSSQDSERQLGFGILAKLCPQSQASQNINGTYTCSSEATTDFRIMRFAELKTRPEFANATAVVPENNNNNRTIAISDFLTFVTQFVGKIFGFKNVQIARTNDVTVNVIDPKTNQTVATAPANYVFFTYTLTDKSGRDFEAADLDVAVLSNDTNTGYLIVPTFLQSSVVGNQTHEEIGLQIGLQIDQMVNSFELLSTPPTTTAQPQQ
jgi:hypothetical protein